MWTRTHQKHYPGVKAADVWHLWTDVNRWHTWHDDLDYCQMKGDFKKGNYFHLKPKGSKPVKIHLVDVQKGKQFTDCTHFFGAKMYDTHALEETEDGVILSNKLFVTGPLKWLWIKLVANDIAKTVPADMDVLANLARGKSHV